MIQPAVLDQRRGFAFNQLIQTAMAKQKAHHQIVHRQQREARGLVLVVQAVQVRHLLPAGAAPAGPEVHQHHLPALLGQARALAGVADVAGDAQRVARGRRELFSEARISVIVLDHAHTAIAG